MVSGYRISEQLSEMDLNAIHGFIGSSYWAAGIPLATFKRALENSLCFGVLTNEGQQVGFARMITDQATFAYLADVFIDEAHRGKGLSKWLMQSVHQHPQLQGLRRMMLATRDAHGLYQQVGYTALNVPEIFMEKWDPQVYAR